MTKTSSILATIILVASIFIISPITTQAQFSGGDGNENSPYIITTAAQLAQLATYVNNSNISYNNKYYKLGNDIDLADYGSYFDEGKGWIPIGKDNFPYDFSYFLGIFDGNNHIITNLYINRPEETFIGLFGIVNGVVKNLGLENVDINGNNNVGSIVGATVIGTQIINCYAIGTVNGNNSVGGLIGSAANCFTSFCYTAVNVSGNDYIGGLGGTVEASHIANSFTIGNTNGNNYIGGLIGESNSGGYTTDINNCYTTGNVSGEYSVGGIAGYASWSFISNCYTTGSVNGDVNIGGIVGMFAGYMIGSNGTVSNCVALNSQVNSTDYASIGRVVGDFFSGGLDNNVAFKYMLDINETYTSWNNIGLTLKDGANITKTEIHADGTFGSIFSSTNGWTIENGMLPGLLGSPINMPSHLLFSLPQIITEELPNGIVGLTYIQSLFAADEAIWTHIDGSLPTGLNISEEGDISGIPTTAGTFNFTVKATNSAGNDIKALSIVVTSNWPPLGMAGSGASGDPWQIYTPAHLEALADFVNAGNGSATSGVYYKMMNNINLSNYSNWEPIGNNNPDDVSRRFQGHFDGNNYAVQNLTINRPSEDFIGLFGYVDGYPNPASIKNLGMEDCDIVGQSRTGSLVGHSALSPISNCYATGIVSGVQYTGGLVGSSSSYIDESYTSVTVNATGSNTGGIAGTTSSAILNCYATGNVNGGAIVGGVLGSTTGTGMNAGIVNCYATGNVSATSYYVGGVVGTLSAYSQVIDCVAANDSVTTTHTSTDNINRVYGNESLFAITLRNNYANSAMVVIRGTSTVTTPNALNGGAGMGKTLAELKVETFYTTSGNWNGGAWDFPTVWKMCEGYLPMFQWQACPPPPPDPPTITTTSLPDGIINSAYNHQLTATGGTPITWSLAGGSLPTGLTLSASGEITGTPTSENTFYFSVKATNSAGSHTQILTITTLEMPTITITTLPDGIVGTLYFKTLTSTGTTPLTWTLESGSLPNNLTLSTAGVISGTPTTAGTFNFTVKATNSVGNNTKALSIAILAPPVITTTTLPNGVTGTAYNQTLTATGTTPITWTLESGNLPNNLTLSTAGVISGTPTTDGTFNFTVKATNSVGSDTKALSIIIGGVGISENSLLNITVFPNPTNGAVTISNPELRITDVEIFDSYGKNISAHLFITSLSNHLINISHLPAGVYFLRIQTDEGMAMRKVVKY